MNDRKMRYALVAVSPGGAQHVIAKAATAEKLEKKRAQIQSLSNTALMVVELEVLPREPKKVNSKLERILAKLRELSPEEASAGTDARLIAEALQLLKGRHRDVVDRIIDAWAELGTDAR